MFDRIEANNLDDYCLRNGKLTILPFTNITLSTLAFIAIAMILLYPWNHGNYMIFFAYFSGVLYLLHNKSFILKFDNDTNQVTVTVTAGFLGSEYHRNKFILQIEHVIIEKSWRYFFPVYLVSVGTIPNQGHTNDLSQPSKIIIYEISRLLFPARFIARFKAEKIARQLSLQILEIN